MDNINFMYVIDGTAAVYGLYVFFTAWKMKRSGEISSFIASPEEMYKCKDKKGFAEAVSDKMMLFGLIAFVFGIINIINETYWQNTMLVILVMGVFLLACGLFVMHLRKAREKYLGLK